MSERNYLMMLFDIVKKYFTKSHGPFKRYGGSSRYSKEIASVIPEHKTYVEPFAGAASVLFSKEKSETEVLSDLDPEIVHAFRMIRKLDSSMIEKLKAYDRTISVEGMKKYSKYIPKEDIERLHRFLYVQRSGFSGTRSTPGKFWRGKPGYDPEKLVKYSERIKNVTVLNYDYKRTLKEFDGPDTFFFIDPPYPGEWTKTADDIGGPVVDLEEIGNLVKALQGNWILALGDTEDQIKLIKSFPHHFTISVMETHGVEGQKRRDRYFATSSSGITKKITKGFLNGSPEGGPHAHTIIRNEGKTQKDGRHLHIFKVDDDVMLATKEDGDHWHALESENSSKTEIDGAHSHVVVMPDGTEVTTAEDGEHDHSTTVETTNFDGNHEHSLTLPDGRTIQSMTVEEFLVEFAPIEDVEIPMPAASEITGIVSSEIQAQQDAEREVSADSELDKENEIILAGFGYRKKQPEDNVLKNDSDTIKKLKVQARNFVNHAIRDGRMKRGKCRNCGSSNAEAHHKDYRKPSDVTWMCKSCHEKSHAKNKNLDLTVVQKSNDEKQIVYGVVLEPDSTDAHNDVISAQEIEQAAHKYLIDARVIGDQHTKINNAELVESFIAPVDFVWNGQNIRKGSWIIGVHVIPKEYWQKIKNGEINSFSMGGYAVRE